jgi:hypothetical protein
LRLLFFFGGTVGVWTQGLTLARQVLFHVSHSANPTWDFFDCPGCMSKLTLRTTVVIHILRTEMFL